MLKNEIRNFSDYFVKELGQFVKVQRESGERAGLNEAEINSVITKTFYLLGRGHKKFEEKAGIK